MLFIALKNKNRVTKSNRKLNKKGQKILVNNKERNESNFQNMSQIIETNEKKSNEKTIEERKSEETQNQELDSIKEKENKIVINDKSVTALTESQNENKIKINKNEDLLQIYKNETQNKSNNKTENVFENKLKKDIHKTNTSEVIHDHNKKENVRNESEIDYYSSANYPESLSSYRIKFRYVLFETKSYNSYNFLIFKTSFELIFKV
jgi:hypothetical protein